VSRDPGNTRDEVPERFVPDLMKGELAEAEHFNRYYWAAPLIRGMRVLDAGCGTAYGSAILSEEASSVVGVDIAESVLESARLSMPDGVTLEHGDLKSLRFPDDTFQAVVCFEVIEHVDDPAAVLDEVQRVVVDDGFVVISSPNRESYVPGNPYHQHEFEPEELRLELQKRFDQVVLFRQSPWMMSAILDDIEFAADGGVSLDRLQARKVVGAEPGTETYTIALASNHPLPRPVSHSVVTKAAELRRWMELFDEQQLLIRKNIERADYFQARLEETADIRRQLMLNEQNLAAALRNQASLDETEARLEDVETQLAESNQMVRALEIRLEELTQEFLTSASWRITAPVRRVSRLAKRAVRS
jgi:SAM-dependent methyltransferase